MLKEIPEFPNYFIDENGKVWTNILMGSKKDGKNRIMKSFREVKPRPTKTLYDRVCMRHISGKRKERYIHRLVAECFIPNPQNKPCVDHIDFNRRNNKVSNLQWVTYFENNNRTVNAQHIIIDNKGRFRSNFDYRRYSLLPSEN